MDASDARTAEAREIQAALSSSGIKPVQIAAEVGRTEQMVQKYVSGAATPPGDVLVRMLREFPGFAERLGFQAVSRAA